ncbi:hypothetical protein PTKIN_Ptkin16aG0007400 [Pterospermum kingtungense]
MALIIPALPDVVSHPQVTIGSKLELVGTCLMDMAKMGIVSEAKVDAFNVPLYFTSPKELRQIIEGNGCFSIERMDILDNLKHHIVMPHLGQRVQYIRAILEMLIVKHFGAEIIDQLFEIYARKLSESTMFLNPKYQQSHDPDSLAGEAQPGRSFEESVRDVEGRQTVGGSMQPVRDIVP